METANTWAGLPTPVWVAIIAAATSVITTVAIRLVADDWLMRRKARSDFTYEQRRSLRQSMAEYEGPMIQAAESLHRRLGNLYQNAHRGWLTTPNEGDGYYYRSTVFRLVALLRISAQLERRGLYFDDSVVEARDRLILRYAKAFQYALIGNSFLEGVPHDITTPTDHMYGDAVGGLAEIRAPEGGILTFPHFETETANAASDLLRLADPVFSFVLGADSDASQLRWDRLVLLDLLLVAFLNAVGFDATHRTSVPETRNVVAQFRHDRMYDNFVDHFLPRMGLVDAAGMRELIDGVDVPSKQPRTR